MATENLLVINSLSTEVCVLSNIMNNTASIIEKIKVFHQKNIFDSAHDLVHHEAVTENAKEIIDSERLRNKCNPSVVEVSCMIHDLIDEKRGDVEGMKIKAKELIVNGGGSVGFADEVVRVVEAHSFGKSQGESIEAEILYDADKLEYVSIDRFKLVIAAVKSGQMSTVKLEEYKSIWKERILKVMPSLHFDISKTLFNKRLESVIEYIKTKAPEYSDWLSGVI